jgi:hypothetical protein
LVAFVAALWRPTLATEGGPNEGVQHPSRKCHPKEALLLGGFPSVPLASLLVPFGFLQFLSAPFDFLWLPLIPLWLPFGFRWLPLVSLLLPFGFF